MKLRGRIKRHELVEQTGDPDLLFADGFDDAILGVATRCGQPTIVVYDREKCIEILIAEARIGGSRFDWHREDAEEHFVHSVEGSWSGPRTPAYVAKPKES
jgi:hypothetical protein